MYKAVDCCTKEEFDLKITHFREEWALFKNTVGVPAPLASFPAMYIVKENLAEDQWTFETGRCPEDDEE